METLPTFKYHPDPIGTGALEASDAECQCCGKARGWIYQGSVYAIQDLHAVCPWCIADGSLHSKFDASLSDADPLADAGLSAEVISEVTCKTPGYTSWQQDSWLVCCGDACEFHGDLPGQELQGLNEAGLAALAEQVHFPTDVMRAVQENYVEGGSPAFYKFKCRHCGEVKIYSDCD